MSKRSGPFATLFAILFSLPFTGAGLLALVSGIRNGQIGGILMGAIFTGVGGSMLVSAIRGRRSRESQSFVGASASIADVVPPVMLDYRTAAAPRRTAAEVYAPLLASAPLPRFETKPGVALSWALPRPSLGNVAWISVFAVVWNVMILPFVVGAIVMRSLQLAAFVSLFVAAGVFIGVIAVKGILARAKLPQVEVSEEPVYIGDEVTIRVEQRGRARINRLQVDLVCRESVTFDVGTTTRSEDNDVLAQSLLDEAGPVFLKRGERWPHQVTARIPPQMPHSFRSKHNAIRWLVRVRADIEAWPDYDDVFEFRVLPQAGA